MPVLDVPDSCWLICVLHVCQYVKPNYIQNELFVLGDFCSSECKIIYYIQLISLFMTLVCSLVLKLIWLVLNSLTSNNQTPSSNTQRTCWDCCKFEKCSKTASSRFWWKKDIYFVRNLLVCLQLRVSWKSQVIKTFNDYIQRDRGVGAGMLFSFPEASAGS